MPILPETDPWWDGPWGAIRGRRIAREELRPSLFFLRDAESIKRHFPNLPADDRADPCARPRKPDGAPLAGQADLDRLHIGAIRIGGKGDDLMSGATLIALKRKFPDAHVTLFARDNSGHLTAHPGVDRLVFGANRRWREVVRDLRGRFDIFIDLAYVPRLWVFHPDHKAWEHEWRERFEPLSWYYTNFYASNHRLAELGRNLIDLANEVLGLEGSVDDVTSYVGPRDRGIALALTQSVGGYVTVHNGSACNRQTKCWPTAHWNELAAWVRASYGMPVVQIGDAREEKIEGAIDLRGMTNMGQAAALIGQARLHVDTEGGPAHLAQAVGRRSVVLFGPTPRVCFGYPRHAALETPLDCRGCWYSTEDWHVRCPKGHDRALCMEAIRPEVVQEAVAQALAGDLAPEAASGHQAPVRTSLGRPRLLVGIPTWDRPQALRRLLDSIAQQTMQPDRIVIVNDGFGFLTENVLREDQIVELRGPRKGPPWSHQVVLDYARAEGFDFVLRLDDDLVLESRDFIERLYELLRSDERVGAVGGVYPPPEWDDAKQEAAMIGRRGFSTTLEATLRGENSAQFYRYDAERVAEAEHLYSSFMYRAEAMAEVGGFPRCYSRVGHREETDATYRLHLAGHRLLIDTGAVARHERCPSGGLRNLDDVARLQAEDAALFLRRLESGALRREAVADDRPCSLAQAE